MSTIVPFANINILEDDPDQRHNYTDNMDYENIDELSQLEIERIENSIQK